MTTRSVLVATLLFGFASGSIGCASRRHMSPDYGRSNRQAFSAQAVRRQPHPPGALPAGLDPDDARIINENYRATLAKKGTEKKGSGGGIIIVNDEEVRRAPRKDKD